METEKRGLKSMPEAMGFFKSLADIDTESPEFKAFLAKLPDKLPEPEIKTPTDQDFWNACDIPTRFRREFASLEAPGYWMDKFTLLKEKIFSKAGFCLVIRGPRGTGKTQLAIEALKYGYQFKGMQCKITSARDIQLETIASFKKENESDKDVLNRFIWVDLLLIDEFDWQPEDRAHYFNNNMFHLLDKRYQWCKSTILTSNATIEEFEKNTDPGILSRMNEAGGRIDCDGWKSFR